MQAEILICKTCKIATNFKPTGTLLPHVKLTHLKKVSVRPTNTPFPDLHSKIIRTDLNY